ncbi:NAD(P)/FAD-dependent oxidoreductase [Lentzea sp.]|uniref:protoporphyrinogen/coproporphyrinogen oxidase n=1 Tax=Lentzea sp. TaxID=56099 RepID=UPI002CA090AC|nr:NAD(P)/FAD-dependent oxidoreductase [Lentzea sp.]HUQ59157.1 NAD(P)/FAD-dependent oxidoreductase [Lentzea sp.]
MTDLDVAVIGAGVAGLTTAFRLRASGREVRVFEAADVVGGRMTTVREDGFLVDTGAEQIPETGYPETWRLLEELGIDRGEVPRIGRGIAMWRGRARPGVASTRGLLSGAGLSVRARLELLRLLRGRFDLERPEDSSHATVAQACRGNLLDYLCQPVVSGFFGWDPARSAIAPFLALLTSIGPASTWRTYRDGMDTLARALASKVDVTTSAPVDRVVDDGSSARISLGGNEISARSVVLAVPAPVVRLVHPEHGSEFIDACSFSSVVKAHLLLDRPLGRRDYAVVVPTAESGTVSTIMFDHLKHPGRAPENRGLVTVMAHPSVAGELMGAPDVEVVERLVDAAERLVPGLRAATGRAIVRRFRHALPEATPRALALRSGFEAGLGGVVDYAGDWVFLSPCSEAAVRSGLRAAHRLARREERV